MGNEGNLLRIYDFVELLQKSGFDVEELEREVRVVPPASLHPPSPLTGTACSAGDLVDHGVPVGTGPQAIHFSAFRVQWPALVVVLNGDQGSTGLVEIQRPSHGKRLGVMGGFGFAELNSAPHRGRPGNLLIAYHTCHHDLDRQLLAGLVDHHADHPVRRRQRDAENQDQ